VRSRAGCHFENASRPPASAALIPGLEDVDLGRDVAIRERQLVQRRVAVELVRGHDEASHTRDIGGPKAADVLQLGEPFSRR
jgi:hypothetical protein